MIFKKLNTEMENIPRTQIKCIKIKTIMSEMKNILKPINSRLNIVEEKISKLKDIATETIQNEYRENKRMKKFI